MAKKIAGQSKYWWAYLVFGILILIAGGNFLAKPLSALAAIAFLTGLYLIISGAAKAIMCVVDRKLISMWGLHLALNILVVVAGVFMITRPAFAVSFLWLFAGLGFLFQGISMIVFSIGMKKLGFSSYGWSLAFGIISILVALSMFSNPFFALSFVSVFVSIGVIVFGIELIVLSFQLKPAK